MRQVEGEEREGTQLRRDGRRDMGQRDKTGQREDRGRRQDTKRRIKMRYRGNDALF